MSYFHPKSEHGDVINNGCSQIPNTVRYQSEAADYRIELFPHGVALKLTLQHQSKARWINNNFNLLIDGKKYSSTVKTLDNPYQRTYCDFLFWGCRTYDIYTQIINFPLSEATNVILEPPSPQINRVKLKVGSIKYVYKKSVLWQAINC